ncbi:hypothetical protein [Candidatus Thiosymbion oneisti]|uniref:hypothetical protein n=1 Tax=Candidatus Thiosymbion oneisti TaxID=589554 RepID=UPI000A9A37B0|nr:hypothetical protein [Candidatus Thiosymbion oneisti]
MSRRSTRPITVLCIGLLAVFPLAAQTPLPPPTESTPSAEPQPVRRWLDEVRAQRQKIRQERRRAAREARRRIDPWGAARQEIREQETQRRHDTFLEHIERDRETFRNQVPWQLRQSPWQEETSGFSAPPLPSPADAATGASGQASPQTLTYPLPGWDNPWYYRGW